MDSLPSASSIAAKPRNIVIFLGAILFFSVIIFYSLAQTRSSTSQTKEDPTKKATEEIAQQTLVYGSWTGTNSVIMAYDLSSGKEGVLANLPSNIKKVSVLSPTTLLYINNTDVRDHGSEIAIYDLTTKKTTTAVTASDGFGIDDYVLSPNHQYISTWEVQVAPDSGVLMGGRSRVYTAQITGQRQKYLIYDEVASPANPVHYPRGILDDGSVFMDRFLPNNGAGWAYGMSVSNFNGTQRQDLANMQNGTYGTQPILSPDGRYFAFAGYDGAFGVGDTIKRGFRQALLTPNTLELLDTQTRERIKLPKISPLDIYSNIEWDEKGQNVSFSVSSKNTKVNGSYTYNVAAQTIAKKTNPTETVAAAFDANTVLVGIQDDTDSTLGNLGEEYAPSLNRLAVKNTASGKTVPIGVSGSMTQLITVVPSNYFSNFTAAAVPSNKNLQLQSFYIKPTLAQQRVVQQSEGERILCRDLATEQCNEQFGTSFPPPKNPSTYRSVKNTNNADFSQCYIVQFTANRGKCYDSPLYVYGPTGTKLTVTVNTPIFEPNAPYTDGFAITVTGENKLQVAGKTYPSISYDYTPAIKRIVPPITGRVVARDQVEQTLREYAKKLGLNQKETFDLVVFGLSQATGPYVQVSFFDQATSHAILPLTFDKQPDVYRNIVFYFKNTSAPYSMKEPTFEKVQRKGVTVLEISGIVE